MPRTIDLILLILYLQEKSMNAAEAEDAIACNSTNSTLKGMLYHLRMSLFSPQAASSTASSSTHFRLLQCLDLW